MKLIILPYFLFLFFLVLSNRVAFSQKSNTDSLKLTLPHTLQVVDQSGQLIFSEEWKPAVDAGNAKLIFRKKPDGTSSLVFTPLSPEQKAKEEYLQQNPPKPKESKYFTTGEKFGKITTTDIDGNKINPKLLNGKIVVLYFWKLDCGACMAMIPELNKVTDLYKNDSDVIFISVSPDDRDAIKKFTSTTLFNYRIIDSGNFMTEKHGINSYPVNLVLDREGKIYFHSPGFNRATTFWIKKSIEQIKQQSFSDTDKK